jgi:transcriptional regulator with XRE-family HTH domain
MTESFAAVMRRRRETAGLSQYRLAKLAGVDHTTVSRLESGQRRPSRSMVNLLAAALGLDQGAYDALIAAAGFAAMTCPNCGHRHFAAFAEHRRR